MLNKSVETNGDEYW